VQSLAYQSRIANPEKNHRKNFSGKKRHPREVSEQHKTTNTRGQEQQRTGCRKAMRIPSKKESRGRRRARLNNQVRQAGSSTRTKKKKPGQKTKPGLNSWGWRKKQGKVGAKEKREQAKKRGDRKKKRAGAAERREPRSQRSLEIQLGHKVPNAGLEEKQA